MYNNTVELSIEDTLKKAHLSNEDTVSIPHYTALCIQMYHWIISDTDQYSTPSWVPMVQFVLYKNIIVPSVTIPKKCTWYYSFTSCSAFHY